MKKYFILLLVLCSCYASFGQKNSEIFIGLSPAFPIGNLSNFVSSGVGFRGAYQMTLKDNFMVGGKMIFHKLSNNGDSNSFLSESAYLDWYFNNKYLIDEIPIKTYIGFGLGVQRSRYTDYFFGEDLPTIGLLLSPKAGLKFEFEKLYISGEGRIYIGGYANSYTPLMLSMGFKLR